MLAVTEARALTTTAGLLAASKLFELTGTSATLVKGNLDRHWPNVRNHNLNDIKPPRHRAI